MKEFIAKHSVRLIGLIGSIAPVLVARWLGVPWEALVRVVAAFLGLGEVAQRKQDTRISDHVRSQIRSAASGTVLR
ncbi:hypothetical protein [Streptomyces sp. NPDC058142]|uniref:hypothetical protein n=1 Tax=Streptomyces sp. NPDC058142 TaxID=3346355 RepID=UPI0036E88C6F